MRDVSKETSTALGLTGAAAGGALGYFAFAWIATQGFYALALPGALVGIGCGLLARHRSVPRGVVCGVAALFLGAFSEARVFPWRADPSLAYFARHLGDLTTLTKVMLALGGLLGFWFGKDSGLILSGRTRERPR